MYNKNKDDAKYFVDVSIYHSGLNTDDDGAAVGDDGDDSTPLPSQQPTIMPSLAPSSLPTQVPAAFDPTDDILDGVGDNDDDSTAIEDNSNTTTTSSSKDGGGSSDGEFLAVVTNAAVVYIAFAFAICCAAPALVMALLWRRKQRNSVAPIFFPKGRGDADRPLSRHQKVGWPDTETSDQNERPLARQQKVGWPDTDTVPDAAQNWDQGYNRPAIELEIIQ
jgi:hypothetical protein